MRWGWGWVCVGGRGGCAGLHDVGVGWRQGWKGALLPCCFQAKPQLPCEVVVMVEERRLTLAKGRKGRKLANGLQVKEQFVTCNRNI